MAPLYSMSSTAGVRISFATSTAHRRYPTQPPSRISARQGYTLVWVGWQFDIPRRNGLMALDAPPALDQGKPITGRVSTTFTPNTAAPTYALDDMGRYADTTRYPPLDPASPGNTLTVRDGLLGAPRT